MIVVKAIVVLFTMIWLINFYIRYHPAIDIVYHYNRIIVLLWYTKSDYFSSRRTYIKLFSI